MIKCPECNKKFKLRPMINPDGTKNWKNILIPDFMSVMFAITILVLMFSYNNDMEKCNEVIENPLEWCNEMVYSDNYDSIYIKPSIEITNVSLPVD